MSKQVKKFAYFDASHDFPEEVVMAAGLTPYKILGDVHVPNDPADQYLQNFLCPAARSMLTEALARSGEWQGIGIAHGCDATNRYHDIYKLHVKTPFLYWFNTPMNINKAAAAFFKKELQRFVKALEKQYGVKITDQKLAEAIKLSNSVKKRMQDLSALRATKDVSNKEYFEACVKAVQLPKDEAFKELDATLLDWSKRKGFPSEKKKVFLTGSDVTYAEWMELMDEAGLRVVRDDLSVGERYYASLFDTGKDPLDAIVAYHFDIPRPATRNPPDPRLDYILKAMDESNLKIAISQNLKFCEPYAFDAVFTVKKLKEKGYHVMHLEREFSPHDMTLKNRLEAFAELTA